MIKKRLSGSMPLFVLFFLILCSCNPKQVKENVDAFLTESLDNLKRIKIELRAHATEYNSDPDRSGGYRAHLVLMATMSSDNPAMDEFFTKTLKPE